MYNQKVLALVYKITNKLNRRAYVGKTVRSLDLKWKYHLAEARIGRNDMLICRAIRKYGSENFTIETLEECDESILNEREIYWISQLGTFGNGYNATKGGEGTSGYKFSKESKKKMSESAIRSRTGKKRGPYKKWSEEAKQKHAAWRTGFKHSSETREKMKQSQQKRRMIESLSRDPEAD